jgi:hypothetical protein
MKPPNYFARKQNGQTIVIFAIILLTLIGMAALMVDGGMAMVYKRQAQAAADAGALYGAKGLCDGKSLATIQSGLSPLNNGTALSLSSALEQKVTAGDTVTATAAIIKNTFFAKLIDQPTINVSATAKASCLIPSHLYQALPLAFQCQNPEIPVDGTGKACGGLTINNWFDGMTSGNGLVIFVEGEDANWLETFVIPEDQKFVCSSDGDMICSGGGLSDKTVFSGCASCDQTSGVRGWIPNICNSDGPGCISYPGVNFPSAFTTLDIHSDGSGQNVEGQPTQSNSFMGSIKRVQDEPNAVYLLPYFSDPPTLFHDITNWPKVTTAHYQLIGEMGFIVTCVSNQTSINNSCPGNKALYQQNSSWGTDGPRTIEGYFVKNVPFNLINPAYSNQYRVGINYVSLTK